MWDSITVAVHVVHVCLTEWVFFRFFFALPVGCQLVGLCPSKSISLPYPMFEYVRNFCYENPGRLNFWYFCAWLVRSGYFSLESEPIGMFKCQSTVQCPGDEIRWEQLKAVAVIGCHCWFQVSSQCDRWGTQHLRWRPQRSSLWRMPSEHLLG